MAAPVWRYACASVRGTSHHRDGKPCQDYSSCEVLADKHNHEVLVAVASDGAGSAKYSQIGSSLICSLFIAEIKAYLEAQNEVQELSREFYEEWIMKTQQQVKEKAEGLGLSARDFACTFLSAVSTDDCALFAQVGDGAIVVDSPEELETYSWQFWPQQGEYENTTFFVTEARAAEKLQFSRRLGQTCDEVALFSDGLQRLALHYQSQSAHSPFFRPFFSALRLEKEARSTKYESSLIAFLDSLQVNERTDDDKTLILATRRKPHPL
jgi:serine/threonine protein phosphatase PrpC